MNIVFLSILIGASIASAESGRTIAGKVVSVEGTALLRSEPNVEKGRHGVNASAQIKPGDTVYEGDVINTSSGGKVKLLLGDKSIIDVGASSLFKVKEYKPNGGLDRNVDIQMSFGSIRAAVNQPLKGGGKFKVRTPAATMGVRGTEFVVKSDMGTLSQLKSTTVESPDKPAPPPSQAEVAQAKASGEEIPKGQQEVKTEVTVVQGKVDVAQEAPAARSGGATAEAPKVVSLTAGTQITTTAGGDSAPAKPVTLSAAQMSSVVSSAKVEDNTFQKALVLDLGAATGGDAATGNGTLAAISNALPAMTGGPMPVSFGDAGFVGTFGAMQSAAGQSGVGGPGAGPGAGSGPVNLPVGGVRKITVVIER